MKLLPDNKRNSITFSDDAVDIGRLSGFANQFRFAFRTSNADFPFSLWNAERLMTIRASKIFIGFSFVKTFLLESKPSLYFLPESHKFCVFLESGIDVPGISPEKNQNHQSST